MRDKPTTDFSGEHGGWITPDGNFYACQCYADHSRICYDAGTTEIKAEKIWVKITYSNEGWFIFSRKATQAQINTAYAWAQFDPERAESFKEWFEHMQNWV